MTKNICIGRQLGSGGREIARRLAERLGYRFYDKEILNLAAKESGFSEKIFEQNDEHKGFLRTLFHLHIPHVSDVNFYKSNLSQESLFQFQSDAIAKAAQESDCIFVGRCADYILRNVPNVTTVFITADIEDRTQRVASRHQCARDEALRIIRNAENSRASYYNYYTGKRWGAAESYDLSVNSSRLGTDGTVDFIAKYIRLAEETTAL